MDSEKKLFEEYNKCQNSDCKDYYQKAIKMIQDFVDNISNEIKDLELQRATIISGL